MRMLPIALVLSLGACATADVVQISGDTYMISQTSAAGMFVNAGKLKADVIGRANAFAASKNKVAIPVQSEYQPPVPGRSMPSFEYEFRVVDKDDPRAAGMALLKRHDLVIQNDQTLGEDIRTKDVTQHGPDTYTELLKLDDLLKRGIITQSEFDAQKKKLLQPQ